eukprot:m.373058 g.373058  ORF g.373058 m.373058 type:complete len:554 (+) comp20883_c0_seq10:319-1980(+)
MSKERPKLEGEVEESGVWNVRAYCAYDSSRRVCFNHMDNAAKAFDVARTYVYARRNSTMMLAGWFVHSYDKRNNTFLTHAEAKLPQKLPPPPFCDLDGKGTPPAYKEYYETSHAAYAVIEERRAAERAKRDELLELKIAEKAKRKKELSVSSPVSTGDVTISAVSAGKKGDSSGNCTVAVGRGPRKRKVTPSSHFGDDYEVGSMFARPPAPGDGGGLPKRRRLQSKHKGMHAETTADDKYSIADLLSSPIASGLTARDTLMAGFSKAQLVQLESLGLLTSPQREAAQWRVQQQYYTNAYTHVMDPFYNLSDDERRRYNNIIEADVEVVRSESGDNSAVVVGMTPPSPTEDVRIAACTTDRSGRTALHRAVAASNYTAVQDLLNASADVTARDICGCTALHEARDGHMAQLLVAAGADPSAKPYVSQTEGDTPLHQAAKAGDTTRLHVLLLAGADADKSNRKNESVHDVARVPEAQTLLAQASGDHIVSRLLSPDAAAVRDPVVDVTQTWKYSCEICEKKFKGHGALTNHLKKHAADRERELTRQMHATQPCRT